MNVDTELTRSGTIELIGRANIQKRPQSHQQGYFLQVADTGAWTLLKSNSDGDRTPLAKGVTAPLGIGRWHRLGLSFSGTQIVASVDGRNLTLVLDASYSNGQVGLGTGSYDTDQFDDLAVMQTK